MNHTSACCCEALEWRTLLAATTDQISEARFLGQMTATRVVIDAKISSPTNVDMYSFSVTDDQRVAIDVDTPTGNLDSILRLFDEDGVELDRNDDAAGPNESLGDDSYQEYMFGDGGTYYVGISGFRNDSYNPVTGTGDVAGSTGTYTLSIVPLPDPDLDDQIYQAHWLGAMTRSRSSDQRSIGATTDVDMFSFRVEAGETISFDIDRPTGTLDSYLRLFNGKGTELASNDDGPTPNESPTSEGYIEYTFAKAGMYYIGVSGKANTSYNPLTGRGDSSSSTGTYILRLKNLTPDSLPLLPDLIPWASRSLGYLYDYEFDKVSEAGRTLMRFTTTSANIGAGPLELRGGDADEGDGTQEVFQRIFDSTGGHEDHLAGAFVYHDEHGHIHFDDYARYRLRQITEGDGVGDVIAGGQKTSFALLDTSAYDKTLPGARQGEHYKDAGQVQGLSVGWADVYEADLPDQWIDVTDVPRGQYWLEIVIDPKNHLQESNESNNRARIKVKIGSGGDGDDQISEAKEIGPIGASARVTGYTISNPRDVDMFSFTVTAGQRLSFDIDRPSFTLDSYIRIFDADGNELAANDDAVGPGDSAVEDESYLRYRFATAGTYYIGISGYDNTSYNPLSGKGDVSGSTASYTLRIKTV